VGSGYVNATVGVIVGSAMVNITADVLDSIVVTPTPVDVVAGTSQAFTAKGYDQYGNEMTISPVWTTTVGSMAGSTLTAQTTVGGGYVNATVGGITGIASINVTADVLIRIELSPDPVAVVIDKSQVFWAVGYDQFDNVVDLSGTIWSTNIGSFTYTTDSNATFKAPLTVAVGYVNATVGGITGSAVVDLVTDNLFRIEIIPNTVDVVANTYLEFTAVGYDKYDNVVTLSGTVWTTNVGTFTLTADENATFKAQTLVDFGFVNATVGAIVGSAVVKIIPDILNRIEITPNQINVIVDNLQTFTLIGYDQFDNLVNLTGTVWSSDVGTIVTSNNTYTQLKARTQTGAGYVRATHGAIIVNAAVTILPDNLYRIYVNPDSIDVVANNIQTFTAHGYDKFDNIVQLTSTVWSTDIGTIIDSNNSYAKLQVQSLVGSGYISAAQGVITALASVNVLPGTLFRISISPATIDIVVNGTQIFTLTGYDQFNNIVKLTGTVWSTDIGTILENNNTYAKLKSRVLVGSGYVNAAIGIIAASAEVKTIPDILHSIIVVPNSANITAGGIQNYSASGYDKFGNIVSITPVWTTNVGLMEGSILKAQTVVGFGYVRASVGAIFGSADVDIIPDVLIKIMVLPDVVNVEVGSTQQFSAFGYDRFNNVISIEPVWSTTVGAMTGAKLTAQTKAATGYVNATVMGITGSAVVFLIPGPLNRINVTPEYIEIVAGESGEFTAVGYDKYNNTLTIYPVWYSSVGTMVEGILTAATSVGTGTVTATYQGVRGLANVKIIPAELDHIFVAPPSLEIITGGIQEFTAIGYDRYNNIVEIEPVWSTDVGIMDGNIFTAQFMEASGYATATVTLNTSLQEIIGRANVRVIMGDIQNKPKIIGKIPNQERFEDCQPWLLYLTPHESDNQDSGSDLRWYATGKNSSLFILSGEYSDDDILKFTPVPNAFGSSRIYLWLVDRDGFKDYCAIWVNLTPVNDEPIIFGSPDLILHYDDIYSFNYAPYIKDIETPTDDLIISTFETTTSSYTVVNGLNVSFNYPESMVGRELYVTIIVSDGIGEGKEIIKVTVTDDWVPKVIEKLPDVILYEGAVIKNVFNLNDYFIDPDEDSLYYSYGETHVSVVIHKNGSVDVSSISEWSGIDTVTFRAEDPIGALAEDTIRVIVLPVNDPPVISGVPDLIVHFDYDYEFDLSNYIRDKDNNSYELKIFTNDHGHIRFDSNNNMIMIINYPESMNEMTVPVTITVSDGIASSSQVILITISDDYPPEVYKPLPDIEFDEDTKLIEFFDLDDYFFDLDGDSLYYTYGFTNIFVEINDDNTVNFGSTLNWYGIETITFRATDTHGAIAEYTIKATVIPVNDAPEISDIPAQKGMVEEMWVLDLAPFLADVDNNITELKILVDSEFVVVSGLTLVFYSERPVDKNLEIVVSDGEKNSTRTFNVTFSEGEQLIPVSRLFNWSIILILLILISCFLVVFRRYRGSFTVEEAFLFYENGRLIGHKTGKATNWDRMEDDVLSGMLITVQDFIKDSFDKKSKKRMVSQKQTNPNALDINEWQLQQLKLEGHNILIERGKFAYLAVVFSGTAGYRLNRLVKRTMKEFENRNADVLPDWNGEINSLTDIEQFLDPFINEGTFGNK
jgi:hypothetical protein